MSNDLQQVEISIKQARDMIKKAKLLERLYKNPQFKELIVEGYLKDEAVRLVLLKSDPQMESEERQKQVDIGIEGIGSFYQHLNTIRMLGNRAKQDLDAHENTRDELHAEEIN